MCLFILVLCALAILATGLPLINTSIWWIRIFDFPRIQMAVFILLTAILVFLYLDIDWIYKLPLLVCLVLPLLYQLHYVVVYTPLYRTQAKSSSHPIPNNNFTLLVSNVRMENEEKARLYDLVHKYNPDILLINEPDAAWANSISSLDKDYPYSVQYPLDNTFGMMLLSKLPLSGSKVNFVVKDDIPSIFTMITLPSGSIIDLYGVHSLPPMPGTDTYERDTEWLIVGKKIRDLKNPTVVAGDLNDVSWSATSKLFSPGPRFESGLFLAIFLRFKQK